MSILVHGTPCSLSDFVFFWIIFRASSNYFCPRLNVKRILPDHFSLPSREPPLVSKPRQPRNKSTTVSSSPILSALLSRAIFSPRDPRNGYLRHSTPARIVGLFFERKRNKEFPLGSFVTRLAPFRRLRMLYEAALITSAICPRTDATFLCLPVMLFAKCGKNDIDAD